MNIDRIDIEILIERYKELLKFSKDKDLQKQLRKKLKFLKLRLKGFPPKKPSLKKHSKKIKSKTRIKTKPKNLCL